MYLRLLIEFLILGMSYHSVNDIISIEIVGSKILLIIIFHHSACVFQMVFSTRSLSVDL